MKKELERILAVEVCLLLQEKVNKRLAEYSYSDQRVIDFAEALSKIRW